MDLRTMYQNAFKPNKKIIRLAPNIYIRAPDNSNGVLTIDSFDNPGHAILLINGDVAEDIYFDGIIYLSNSRNYCNIKCWIIVFIEHSVCVVSKLDVYAIYMGYSTSIELSINNGIMAVLGNTRDIDLMDCFPNLIIKSNDFITSGGELIHVITDNNKIIYMLANTDHKYYPALANLPVFFKEHFNTFGNILFYDININIKDSLDYICYLVINIIKLFTDVSVAPLIKNACK